MGTQKLTLATNFSASRISKPGTGGILIIAPRDAGATVAADVIHAYRDADTVATEQGGASGLAASAPYAKRNIQRWYMGAFADDTNAAVGSRTFGANPGPAVSTGTLPSSETNIYVLSSCTIDGVAVTRVNYTIADPTTVSPMDNTGNGEVWFNPITRAFKTSRASSGTGTGIILTYKRARFSTLFAQILQKPVQTLTFGGNWRFTPQYAAVWQALVNFGADNDLMVYGATADSPDPTNTAFQNLVATERSDSFQLIAAQQTFPATEDLGVAYACLNAKTDPGHTLKDQPAPEGITFLTDLPYTRTQYGDDLDPNTGTFHYIGVNAIVPSDDGAAMLISSERCTTIYSDATTVLFGGVRKQANASNDLVRFDVNKVLTDAKGTAKFDKKGLAVVEGAFIAGLTAAAVKGWIDPADTDLSFPTMDETTDSDRRKRTLQGVSYAMRIVNPLQTVEATAVIFQ